MFDNIGEKIKGLAKATFIISSIISIIVGLVVLVEELIGLSLFLIFIGPILSWISSWILYGFGELITNTSEMKDSLADISNNTEKIYNSGTVNKEENLDKNINKSIKEENLDKNINKSSSVTHIWRCSNCNKMISDDVCPYCGHRQ